MMTKLNEYRRVIGYSYLLYIALIIPVSLFHELGHTAICSLGGYQFDIWLDFRGGHSICYGIFGNNSVTDPLRGIFGLLAFLAILAMWYCLQYTLQGSKDRNSIPYLCLKERGGIINIVCASFQMPSSIH